MMQSSAKRSASNDVEGTLLSLTDIGDAPVPTGSKQMRGDYTWALPQGIGHLNFRQSRKVSVFIHLNVSQYLPSHTLQSRSRSWSPCLACS